MYPIDRGLVGKEAVKNEIRLNFWSVLYLSWGF